VKNAALKTANTACRPLTALLSDSSYLTGGALLFLVAEDQPAHSVALLTHPACSNERAFVVICNTSWEQSLLVVAVGNYVIECL
jgi:hypothetical protein